MYHANFEKFSQDGAIAFPDTYEVSSRNIRPASSFVVSRDNQGNAVSRYGDDTWDFRMYRLAGDSGSARVNFKFAVPRLRDEAKWLVFLLIYVAESESNCGMSIATIMNYLKAVRKLFYYSDENRIPVSHVVCYPRALDIFINSLNNRNLLIGFSSVLARLASISSDVSGYKVSSLYYRYVAREKSKCLPEDFQHPVIPPRILSVLISEIELFISNVKSDFNNLLCFIEKVLEDTLFARSEAKQRQLSAQKIDMRPFFMEASSMYGLDVLFLKYGVNSMPSLSKFLTRFQHACRLKIHIYTGMRQSEALSLRVDSLVSEERFGRNIYKFIGDTSKLVGQKKRVSWATSKEVVITFGLAKRLALLISKNIDKKLEKIPLFISPVYLKLTKLNVDFNGFLFVTRNANKPQEAYEYFSVNYFRITSFDFQHLVSVDPFRSWHEEGAYKLGSTWRFTTHQFRRSLAFYVSQSANVSLPALKSQLKHISREMTLYYCNSSAIPHEFDHDEHISHLIRGMKPESDAFAYSETIRGRDEPLFGAVGKFIGGSNKIGGAEKMLIKDREDLIKRFKKGELAYSETPLGACMTTSPCDKKLLRLVSACIGCDKAIIKPSKLNRVIARQQALVADLKCQSEDSLAYRTEVAELDSLESYQGRLAVLIGREG